PHQNMTAETLAVFTVPSTGGWENFREFKVKLTRPVSGKTNLVLRFSKTGCCNFAGWRFL
ncbi:MAG: carbohydrate-binding protein, partial [Lentisphaeria bacterium]|nr:carbohydrate-binding protein [Lentisphaeria bacterium]